VAELPAFRIDHQTVHWIRELSPRLAYAPKSRIGQELIRILRADGSEGGVRSVLDLDLFRTSAPTEGVLDPGWLHEHAASCTLLASPDAHPVPAALKAAGDGARLVPLLVSWGHPGDDAIADYGWSRRSRRHAVCTADMLDLALAAVDAPAADRRELIHRSGDAFPTLMAAAAAIDHATTSPSNGWHRWWNQWQRNGPELVKPRLVLAADEVAAAIGCDPGPELGAAMSRLAIAQVRGEVRTANGARRWLGEWAAGRDGSGSD
jgi:hypothetical protein